ncbi:hypothetical protein PAXINDRAFT_169072 [Paxillus involutus ATCC 200175]|uniref:Uncharacterized protein n=1 Tax=Paxillus involutus ATCC 200175 TaxID=664439 RepID=A0A0C9TZ65_PAXIN|nr:hypothetical protein PAXINDRAFT_169072 [Paxillus involutus ATCC 200175]
MITRHSGLSVEGVLLPKLDEFYERLVEWDGDLPAGLIDKLQELRDTLQGGAKGTPFSKVEYSTFQKLNISHGLLDLSDAKKQETEGLGQAEPPACTIPMHMTQRLIHLVRDHVSMAARPDVLINVILLRLVSVMRSDDMEVNIVPGIDIPPTTFHQDSGNHSFSGAVDFFVVKNPVLWTSCYLVDPVISSLDRLAKGFVVFAAKRESFKDTFPQAAVAAASFCEIKHLSTIRGCVTSGERWLFFVYEKNLDGGPRGVVRTSLIFELERELNGLALILGLLRDWADNATESHLSFFTHLV